MADYIIRDTFIGWVRGDHIMGTIDNIDRRMFMRLGGIASATTLFSDTSLSDSFLAFEKQSEIERSLSFYNVHTNETLRSTYWAEGEYIPESLKEIDHLLRDFRTGEVQKIDTGLLELLHAISKRLNTTKPFQVISGYRSAKTNDYLRRHTTGVEKNSLHMEGQAIDVKLTGVSLSMLKRAAMEQRMGGVGLYPDSGFVHVDVGEIRYW